MTSVLGQRFQDHLLAVPQTEGKDPVLPVCQRSRGSQFIGSTQRREGDLPWSYPVILSHLKTAISLPDETFDRASRRARELGLSRSQFFAIAAQSYLDTLDRQSLTARIDQALALVGDDPETAAVIRAGRRLLAQDDW